MKHSLFAAGLVGMILVPALGFSNADPLLQPSGKVPFQITSNGRTTQNRLVIPRRFLEGAISNPLAANPRTVMAGLAISISVASLVFLIIRRKSRAAQLTALFIALGGAGLIWVDGAIADGPPPTDGVRRSWQRVKEDQQNVIIEITEQGEAVELVLGTKYHGRGGDRKTAEKPD